MEYLGCALSENHTTRPQDRRADCSYDLMTIGSNVRVQVHGAAVGDDLESWVEAGPRGRMVGLSRRGVMESVDEGIRKNHTRSGMQKEFAVASLNCQDRDSSRVAPTVTKADRRT